MKRFSEVLNKKRGGVGSAVFNFKAALVGALLCFALGSYVANETNTRPERPVLRAISWAARWGLRAMVFMEPAPPELKHQTFIGADGYETVDHGRSL